MIDQIIYSLNCLEVKGKHNLDILLGCILQLEKLREELNKPEESNNEGVED